jgi:hypothetical protein
MIMIKYFFMNRLQPPGIAHVFFWRAKTVTFSNEGFFVPGPQAEAGEEWVNRPT